MHIAIDYTPAVHQRAGIGRYTRGLIRALTRLDAENQYTLLVLGRTGTRFIPTKLPANFRLRFAPISDRWATILKHKTNFLDDISAKFH